MPEIWVSQPFIDGKWGDLIKEGSLGYVEKCRERGGTATPRGWPGGPPVRRFIDRNTGFNCI